MGDLHVTLPVPVLQPADDPSPIEFGTGPFGPVSSIGFRWNGLTVGGDITDSNTGTVVGEIPLGFTTADEDVEITIPLDLTGGFSVALVWHSDRLRLRVTRDRDGATRFHNL